MSRGLGQLQRAILTTLDDARRSMCSHTDLAYRGRRLDLPDDVYDLRASLQYLGRATNQVQDGLSLRKSTIVKSNYASAFCRAVRRLVEEDYLEQWSSPIFKPTPWGVEAWANRRFVKRTNKPFLPIFPAMYDAYRLQLENYDKAQKKRSEMLFRCVSA